MINAEYEYRIDLDGDGHFESGDEDVTQYVTEASWRQGNSQPEDTVAQTAQARLRLDNQSKRFSPSSGSAVSGFTTGKLLRVRMKYPADCSGAYQGGVTRGATSYHSGDSAAYFDGVDGYVNVLTDALKNSINGNEFAIMFYFKAANASMWTDGDYHYAVRLATSSGDTFHAAINGVLGNRFTWERYVDLTSTNSYIDGFSDTEWHQVIITWSRSTSYVAVYKDGEAVTSATVTLPDWENIDNLNLAVLGASNTTPDYPLDGYMCHVAVWSEPLTSTDAVNLWDLRHRQENTVLQTKTDSLVAYWKLDELSNTDPLAVCRNTGPVMFTGYIDDIRPFPDETGTNRYTNIYAEGYLTRLQGEDAKIETLVDARTDEVIQGIYDNAAVDAPGGSPILDEGIQVYDVVGDNWRENTSIYGAFRNLLQAEQGWLYVGRGGRLRFRNRHFWGQSARMTVPYSLAASDLSSMDYRYGTDIENDITVQHHPRTLGVSTTDILGTIDNAIRLRPGDSRTVTLRYSDDSGNKIGGLNPITPVDGVDFNANTDENGNGEALTFGFSAELYGDKAELTWTNSTGKDGYVLAGAQVRGQKITDFNAVEVHAEDSTSITAHGRRPASYDLAAVDDFEYAEQFAGWILSLRKDPVDELYQVTIPCNASADMLTLAAQLDAGTMVTIAEGQTGVSGTYFVVGEEHDVSSEYNHTLTLTLRTRSTQEFWLLGTTGFGELGQKTRLGL